ncbi:glycosyltransferase [Synechococcus sp. M16CYN]|uniref:glycosyltransferase n=1 Tax=Synechococcus sp. M16CYN TaxID=3103139 RepID=UPI0032510721
MTVHPLRLVLVNTPIGALGSGRGGGVELTLTSLVQGLILQNHRVTLISAMGSQLPSRCSAADLVEVDGVDQPSWQHANSKSSVIIPRNGLLPALWKAALEHGERADAVINCGYDWLPLWLTPYVRPRLFHLISMGNVAMVMREAIEALACSHPGRLAFHTHRQAADFCLPGAAKVVGNGFDLSNYNMQTKTNGPLGWAGRIAPEKGLEDAAAAAAALGEPLLVWGFKEDRDYADFVEASVPAGTLVWRGFCSTQEMQEELGRCRALISTPKWNEAYGNVVVEALACGVPVIAYDRGGPGELIKSGETGWLVPADDVAALTSALNRIDEIDRMDCRAWVESHATHEVFSARVYDWIRDGLRADANLTGTY